MKQIIVAFDFDNTLTDRDSLLPFLFYTHGNFKTLRNLFLLIPSFVRYVFGNLSRQETKESVLTQFYKNCSFSSLQAKGKTYADDRLDAYLKSEAMERLAWHQSRGHRCLLVSASLELYLKPWSERHGFAQVIGSKLQLTEDGHVTGKLNGLNCWGPEKKRRLIEYLGNRDDYEIYAYGDSRGDQELLELADHPFYRSFWSAGTRHRF